MYCWFRKTMAISFAAMENQKISGLSSEPYFSLKNSK
jgi:hypothetical protein